MKTRLKITIAAILGFLGVNIAVSPIFCPGFDVLPVEVPIIPCFSILIVMPILTLFNFIF
jgi:hypothetical protein